MKSFVLHGNARSVEVTVPDEGYIKVYSYNSLAETHLSYFLAQCDYEKLASFTSICALLKFAKENHVFRDYPKILCPCPPETSPLDEVGGGILARHTLLNESVSHEAHLVAFNNHHASNCYCPCDECCSDHYPVNGSSVPLNLE